MICLQCIREFIYFYICHIYDDMKLDEYNDDLTNTFIDNDTFIGNDKSSPLIPSNENNINNINNVNNVLEIKSEKWKDQGIELVHYSNDKYSDGNIVIVLDKFNSNHNISNLRSRKDNESDWIVL